MGGDSSRRKRLHQYGKSIDIYYGQIFNIEEMDQVSRKIMTDYFGSNFGRFACCFSLFDPSSKKTIYSVVTFLEEDGDVQAVPFTYTGQMDSFQNYIKKKFIQFYREKYLTIKEELRRRFLETDLSQVKKITRFQDLNEKKSERLTEVKGDFVKSIVPPGLKS